MSGAPLLKSEELGEEEDEELDEELVVEEGLYVGTMLSFIEGGSLQNFGLAWFILIAQVIVLFSLSWQEDQDAYKCLGPSAEFSTIICTVLVIGIVTIKLKEEEMKAVTMRLYLLRHTESHESSIFFAVKGMLTGDSQGHSPLYYAKLLLVSLFHQLHAFGVITFVYVASLEQIMLFDTALQYIINSVVILVLVEIDGLFFQAISGPPFSLRALLGGHSVSGPGDRLPSRQTQRLTSEERRVASAFWWVLSRLNFIAMLSPLLTGKLTGAHCSEQSEWRVSEIGMLLLMSARILCNILLDGVVASQQGRFKGQGAMYVVRFCLVSIVENTLPALLYLLLLYFALVKVLKPPTDDDLFS
jgi:hypothetical protein